QALWTGVFAGLKCRLRSRSVLGELGEIREVWVLGGYGARRAPVLGWYGVRGDGGRVLRTYGGTEVRKYGSTEVRRYAPLRLYTPFLPPKWGKLRLAPGARIAQPGVDAISRTAFATG